MFAKKDYIIIILILLYWKQSNKQLKATATVPEDKVNTRINNIII